MATELCPVSPRCHPQASGLPQPPVLHQAVSGLIFFPLPGHPSHRHTLHRAPALPPSCLSPCPGGQERVEPLNPGSRARSWFCSRVGVWGLGCPRHHRRVQKTSEEGCRKGMDGQGPACPSQALGSARRLSPRTLKGLPPANSWEEPAGGGLGASWERPLCLSQTKPRADAPQPRQHEVILPVGISCPLNTEWSQSRPLPHPWALGLTKYLGHSLPGTPGPGLWATSPLETVWVPPCTALSKAKWAGVLCTRQARFPERWTHCVPSCSQPSSAQQSAWYGNPISGETKTQATR